MNIDEIQAGDIFLYPYLWSRQYQRGETEGRKNRQTALAITIKKAELHMLVLLAITSKQPSEGQIAIPVPPAERKLANLDDMDLWIIVNEYNSDCLEHSYYFQPKDHIGKFSDNFTLVIAKKLAETIKLNKAESVKRFD